MNGINRRSGGLRIMDFGTPSRRISDKNRHAKLLRPRLRCRSHREACVVSKTFRSLHSYSYQVWAAGALVSNVGT